MLKSSFFSLLVATALVACSASSNNNNDTDNENTEHTEQQEQQTHYVLTSQGIEGVLNIGSPVQELPQSVDNLYDTLVITEEENEMEGGFDHYATLAEQFLFSLKSWDGSTLNGITVYEGANVYINFNGEERDPWTLTVSELIEAGAESFFAYPYGGGFKLGSYFFNLNDYMTQDAAYRAEVQENITFTAADFVEGAHPKSISI